MRSLACGIGLLVLRVLAAPPDAPAQAAARLPEREAIRLAEVRRLAGDVCDRVWPGWGRTALPVLLITDSAEFLMGHPQPSAEFVPLDVDSVLQRRVWTRPRRLSPTMLATYPAVGGLPTIVVGTAERTGKQSTDWVLTVLHEHFHQWQYSQPGYYPGVERLDLARGDSTGQWMLDYPFPYHSAPVQDAVRRLATALTRALDAPRSAPLLRAVAAARDTLRQRLAASDYRYFEFQLWQEGVARYLEYAAARAAAASGEPPPAFRSLPDYRPYGERAERARAKLGRDLNHLSLARQRRVAFYPLGAAIALLLDRNRPDWKRAYADRPFALAALLTTER